VNARLYVIALSNPAAAARAMLAYKRLPHRVVELPAGFHPPLLRAAGFAGSTVPALELADGRRIQGSLAIPRVLDELIEERPLYPRDPSARRAVEAAERWGHAELQPVPRRLIRWAMAHDLALRRWLAADILHLPAPGLSARLGKLIATRLAAVSEADDRRARADLAALPGLLDRVDALLRDGTIGADPPNAADFQILSSVRVLSEFADLERLTAGRPCAAAARRLFPSWDGPIPSSPRLSSE
jgi:glutathione S-transferase